MRRYSEECGALHPDRLRGTNLRKHIATTCINLNLKDHEVSDLANFMGHDEKIHKNHYRHPILSREIFQVSKLLEIVHEKDSDDEMKEDTKRNFDSSMEFSALQPSRKFILLLFVHFSYLNTIITCLTNASYIIIVTCFL